MEESIQKTDPKLKEKLLKDLIDIKQKLIEKNRLSNLDLIEHFNKSAVVTNLKQKQAKKMN